MILAAVATALLIHTGAEGEGTQASRSGEEPWRWQTLREWLARRGGYVHPALELSWVSHGGISMMGVVTNESLLEGTVVIELPRFTLLDLELFGSMPEYAAITSAAPNCTLSKGFTRSLRHLKLLAMLAIEKSKGSASEFAPYLDLLPSKADLQQSDLYYAGEDVVRDFGGLPIMSFWRRIQAEHYKELEDCFHAMKRELPDETSGASWEDVEALLRMHRSRHFSVTEPRSLEFLSPAADYVNTGITSEQNVRVVLIVGDELSQKLTVQFVVSRVLGPGQELISSYFTGLDNEDVLFRWNMYLEENEIGLDASEAAICTEESSGIRAASLQQLDLSDELRSVPRCRREFGQEQATLRCSLARLAYELCAATWFPGASPRPKGRSSSKGNRIAGYLIMYSMILRNRGDMVGAKGALQELFARADQGLVATSLMVDGLLHMTEWLLEEERLEDETCAHWLSITESVKQDRGGCCYKRGYAAKTLLQEAEKHVLQATRLRDDPRAYFKHGLILSALDHRLNALDSFRKCLELSHPGMLIYDECDQMVVESLEALGLRHTIGLEGLGAMRPPRPMYSNQSIFLKKLL